MPHAGVVDLLKHCSDGPGRDAFFVAFLVGASRSGKTHFSIRLAHDLAARGLFPRLIEGNDFAALLAQAVQWGKDDVVIVDDAECYLAALRPGGSGPLVAFIEQLRAAKAGIVFLSDRELEKLECDDHIRSRLTPGQCAPLGNPEEADMAQLVLLMGRQHGIRLTDRKVSFILRRVGRTVPSIEAYFDRLAHLATVLGRPIKFPLLSGAV